MFSQSLYSVNKDDGAVEVLLNINNPSSTAIFVLIDTTDGSATGE